MAIDPYRTLGLLPGASAAEVKRAYRRLAKAFHPDSAGPAALPRFLAIHEAYEHLANGQPAARGIRTSGSTGDPRSGGGAGAGAPGAGAGGPGASEPWRADPSRARAAREQARARGRGSATGPGSEAGAGSTSGPAGGWSRDAGAAAGPRGSATGASGAAPRGGAGSSSTRRRASRKATLGSTSYDEARDGNDTTWAGASWYGPTSGEYWRVNPREYADPRKHGPEYQSRARRHSTTAGEAWDEATEADQPLGAAGDPPTGEADAPDDAPPLGFEPPEAEAPPRWGAADDDGTAAARETARAWTPPRRERMRSSIQTDEEEGTAAAVAALARLLDSEPRDPVRRLGYALVAWAPLGLASAAVISTATGCATYGASCTGAAPLLPWLAQALILGLLLLVPRLARILAAGSIAILLALVPLTTFLLAFGGTGDPGAPAVVQTLLAGIWLVGIAAAIVGLTRIRRVAGP